MKLARVALAVLVTICLWGAITADNTGAALTAMLFVARGSYGECFYSFI